MQHSVSSTSFKNKQSRYQESRYDKIPRETILGKGSIALHYSYIILGVVLIKQI